MSLYVGPQVYTPALETQVVTGFIFCSIGFATLVVEVLCFILASRAFSKSQRFPQREKEFAKDEIEYSQQGHMACCCTLLLAVIGVPMAAAAAVFDLLNPTTPQAQMALAGVVLGSCSIVLSFVTLLCFYAFK